MQYGWKDVVIICVLMAYMTLKSILLKIQPLLPYVVTLTLLYTHYSPASPHPYNHPITVHLESILKSLNTPLIAPPLVQFVYDSLRIMTTPTVKNLLHDKPKDISILVFKFLFVCFLHLPMIREKLPRLKKYIVAFHIVHAAKYGFDYIQLHSWTQEQQYWNLVIVDMFGTYIWDLFFLMIYTGKIQSYTPYLKWYIAAFFGKMFFGNRGAVWGYILLAFWLQIEKPVLSLFKSKNDKSKVKTRNSISNSIKKKKQ